MRLSKFIIRNFKGIKELEFTVPRTDDSRPGSADFLTIIGENNRCKSTVLEALRLAFPKSGLSRPEEDHFPGRNIKEKIEIELHFNEISPSEEKKVGIRTHVWNGEYRIKKEWACNEESGRVENSVRVFCPDYELSEVVKNALLTNGPDSLLEQDTKWSPIVENYKKQLAAKDAGKGSKTKPKTKLTDAQVSIFLKFVAQNYPDMCERGEPTWLENPGGLKANPDAALPSIVFVPAITLIDRESNPKKDGVANKILTKLFESYIENDPEAVECKAALDKLNKLFDQDSGMKTLLTLQDDLSKRLRRIVPLSVRLRYQAPEISNTLSESARLKLRDGDFETDPELQGHGAQRSLVLVLLEMWAQQLAAPSEEGMERKPVILLIEEPEIYLQALSPSLLKKEKRRTGSPMRLAYKGQAQCADRARAAPRAEPGVRGSP